MGNCQFSLEEFRLKSCEGFANVCMEVQLFKAEVGHLEFLVTHKVTLYFGSSVLSSFKGARCKAHQATIVASSFHCICILADLKRTSEMRATLGLIFFISCSYQENFTKIIGWHPHLWVPPPRLNRRRNPGSATSLHTNQELSFC